VLKVLKIAVINRGAAKPKQLHMLCDVFQPSDVIVKGFKGSVSAVGRDCNAEICSDKFSYKNDHA
jgi:hypothetical protein